MKRVLIIFCLMLVPSMGFAISIVGGQGYGTFRLSGAGSTSLASIMTVGVKFNKYIELKYLSLDTSFRMPVLPFRIYDVNYNNHVMPNGDTNYIYYDSDVFGLSLSLPFTENIGISAMYGLGRAKIYSFTKTPGIDDPTAVLHRGLVQVFNSDVHINIPIWDPIVLTPAIGTMMYFLDSKSGYSNAMSWYFMVSASYVFNKDDNKEEKK
ncbi:MAG: hypothetical protein NTY22_05055 [Proteobacteria bacterium]|nr:hypothetical protein [Pseudomonadota bacterium]